MKKTRIALIMGGGVSLGSFSGGALAQVVRVLKDVQRGPAKIDVMSGASAGSMTLGVVAYHLFKGSTDDAIEESLYNAWVKQIGLKNLVPEDFKSHKTTSLFTDKTIHDIAKDTIHTDQWPDSPSEPHPLFSDGMLVSFSLTNMNGIPVRAEGQLIRQPVSGGGPATGEKSVFADAVQTTFHNDLIRFELRRNQHSDENRYKDIRLLTPWGSKENQDKWEIFRKGAISSGAFPAAFPPGRILRTKEEYGRWWPSELENGQFVFDYLDGGVTRNEPLREAIHLASLRDKGEDVERVFILIDPNVSGTSEVYPLSFNQKLALKEEHDEEGKLKSFKLKEPEYMDRLGGVMGRFVGVLASQATFRDWLKAAHYNSLVEWKDRFLELIDDLEFTAGSGLSQKIDILLQDLYTEKIVRTSPDIEIGAKEKERIRDKIRKDTEKLSENNSAEDTHAKLKLLIEQVANLKDKRKLNMVAITPASMENGADHRIAGNFLRNFGGFFEEKFRDHDFKVGKHIAASVLSAPIANNEGEAKRLLKHEIDIPPAPDPIVPSPGYNNVDENERKRLEMFLDNLVDEAIPDFPKLLRFLKGPVRKRVVSKLSKSLKSISGGETNYVMIRFKNVGSDWYLKGFSGDDTEHKNENIIDTMIGIRKQREGAVSYEMFGPHLAWSDEDNQHYFEFYESRGWLRSDKHRLTIPVEGDFKEWFNKACYNSRPGLICDLKKEDTIEPSRVCEVEIPD